MILDYILQYLKSPNRKQERPFATKAQKEELIQATNLTFDQITDFLGNYRKKMKKRSLEVM
jgi:hypothetical protein